MICTLLHRLRNGEYGLRSRAVLTNLRSLRRPLGGIDKQPASTENQPTLTSVETSQYMKNRLKITLSLAALVLALAISGIAQKTGEYKPTDPSNAGVELAADFAVKTRSEKTKKTVKLSNIVSAEDQEPVLGARNFKLCMNVTTNGKASSAQALITMDQYSNFKLVSWTAAKCFVPAIDELRRSLTTMRELASLPILPSRSTRRRPRSNTSSTRFLKPKKRAGSR